MKLHHTLSILFVTLGLCLSVSSSTRSALGYSIHSGLTEGCHERITSQAFRGAIPQLMLGDDIVLPQSEAWQKVADRLLMNVDLSSIRSDLDPDYFKLTFVSALLGVRSPDTEGHAVTNFSSLRQIHADPSAEGQYAHALRGPDDDGPGGDLAAIEGTRAQILALVSQIGESLREKSPEEQIITVQLYFDFYGLIEIEVWEPAYLMGRALHALQDSFAHTIRSDDLKRILHVLNYVDAITGDLDESIDGLPHSDAMDQCDGETEPVADTAVLASAALITSMNQAVVIGDVSPVIDVLDEWVTYEPGCTIVNNYCDSPWVDVARKDQTGPYLEELIGCQSGSQSGSQGGSQGGSTLTLIGLILTLLISFMWRRSRGLCLLICSLALSGAPQHARAQVRVQSEVHASVLSDTPDRSVLASTYGWGLRGSYAWDSWAALLHVEQSLWLSTELTDRTTPGALNVGIGGAYLYGDGFRSSLALGTSTLLFDTLFDEQGTTGLFLDLRPIELCWRPQEWLALNLTPLSFTFISPVLESPSIRMVLYRTVFGAEVIF